MLRGDSAQHLVFCLLAAEAFWVQARSVWEFTQTNRATELFKKCFSYRAVCCPECQGQHFSESQRFSFLFFVLFWNYIDQRKTFYLLGKAFIFIFKIFLMFIHFWERQRQSASGGGEREAGSEAGSSLWDVSTEPDVGLKPMNHEIVTWTKVGHLTDWATQVPQLGKAFKTHYVSLDKNKNTNEWYYYASWD